MMSDRLLVRAMTLEADGVLSVELVDPSVGPETSILQALLDDGVDVLHDCTEGICGSCETKVIEGEVDHRDYVLTDREKAAGDCMMVCVSRACGKRLVLGL
jgi:ferredoxin